MDSVFEQAAWAVEERLSREASAHCMRVSLAARQMAADAGADPEEAALAGLLHDWSREEPDGELLAYARTACLPVSKVDEAVPHLLHARVGASRVAEEFPGLSQDVIDAIGSHTLGAEAMTPLAKVVYVADVVEPGRDFPGVEGLRHAVRSSGIDEAFAQALSRTVEHLVRARRPIHPKTVEVFNAHVAGV